MSRENIRVNLSSDFISQVMSTHDHTEKWDNTKLIENISSVCSIAFEYGRRQYFVIDQHQMESINTGLKSTNRE